MQRNDPCHCGSGRKYKVCCMRKDEARKQLSQSSVDVNTYITAQTKPYTFWQRWSKALQRSDYGLVFELLTQDGELKHAFKNEEDFFGNLQGMDLPAKPNWSLLKLKIDNDRLYFLTKRIEKSRHLKQRYCLMRLQQTEGGWRVDALESLAKNADEAIYFDDFEKMALSSAEKTYCEKLANGWQRPNLADRIPKTEETSETQETSET